MENAYPPAPLINNKIRTPLGPINGSGIFAMNLFKGYAHKTQQYLRAYAHVYQTADVSDYHPNAHELVWQVRILRQRLVLGF